MTFTEIVGRITSRLNITQAASVTRIGESVNDVYKNVTTSVGLGTSRRTEVQATATISSQFVTFTGIEKVISVIDKSTGQNRFLDEVTVDELDRRAVTTSDVPTAYAIYRANAGSVQIKTDATAQTAYTLYAPGLIQATTLSGSQEPAFPESFHDLLVSGVLYEEYMKLEKPGLAKIEEDKYKDRLGDLRLFIQLSPQQDIYRSKLAGSTTTVGSTGTGAAGGGSDGATSYTQTGLITFDRTAAASTAPFAVASGSAKVANLDVDLLDGQTGSYYSDAGNLTGDIAAARLAAAFVWASYTPAWTGSVTNPAIGNGSISGRYLQIGKMVWFRMTIGVGATTTVGSGTYSFSVPVAMVTSGSGAVGYGRLFDSGTNTRTVIALRQTSTTFNIYQDTNAASGITAASPFVPAVGDTIEIEGFYEAA